METTFLEIIITIVTGVITWIGITLKNAYTKYIDTKTKKEIVTATVKYIEQITKNTNITNKDKFESAKTKSLKWIKEKGLKINETELEVLIENAVCEIRKNF